MELVAGEARRAPSRAADQLPVGAASHKRHVRLRFYAALAVGDCLAVLAGFLLAGALRFSEPLHGQALAMAAAVLPLFIVFSSAQFRPAMLIVWRSQVPVVIGALIAAVALVQFIGFYLKAEGELSRAVVALGIIIAGLFLILERMIVGTLAHRALDGVALSSILIREESLFSAPAGTVVLDAVDVCQGADINDPFVLDRLARRVGKMDVVYLVCRPERRRAWAHVLRGIDVRAELLLPELNSYGAIGQDYFAGIPAMLVNTGTLRFRDEVSKRALDLTIVIPALLVLAPLMLFVALAIKLDSPGPAMFVQDRVGRNNQLFRVRKFRSMHVWRADHAGAQSTRRGDDRITRIGRIIRATSIDELPQLLNILFGQMSFVGPRPHALGSLAGNQLFWEVDQRYISRHVCKPGLTGLAQVRGLRGATNKREDLVNRLQADLEYISRWSLWRDIHILLSTVRVVVHRNAF